MFTKHKKVTLGCAVLLALIVAMFMTGTLSYPWIMLDRQTQLLTRCIHPTQTFDAAPFGFTISAPQNRCILPHRIFPADTSIQIVPEGYYSVWNEYAKGTIAEASLATFLFEPLTPERNAQTILRTLESGGFLVQASTTEYVTANGFTVIEVRNASGIEAGKLFDWALIDHPNGKTTLSILSLHPEDPTIFHELINQLAVTHNEAQ